MGKIAFIFYHICDSLATSISTLILNVMFTWFRGSILFCTMALIALPASAADGEPAAPAAKAEAVKNVDPKQALDLVTPQKGSSGEKVTVLDVRTPDEFAAGHIEGAKNIDFLDSSFAAEAGKLDKSKPYLVHCQAGGRSARALEVLKKLGFSKIYHLPAGMKGWKEAGNPTAK